MKDLVIKGLIALSAIFAPIVPMIFSCGVLIFADLVTGILAARKRGEKVKSAEMRRSVSKFIVYQIAILSAFVLEKYMLQDLIPVSKIVAGVIGMVEFTSILENGSSIAGKDLLSLVLEKLGSKNAEKNNGPKN
jgi:hypothetical protein